MSDNQSFFETIWSHVLSIFKGSEKDIVSIEHDIAKFADSVTNLLKNNPTVVAIGRTALEALATSINPALVPMVSGLELEIPNILNLISEGTTEISKPLQDQLNDLVTKLETIKGINNTVYAGILATINPAIQRFIIANSDIQLPPNNQLITAGQAVHGD